MKRLSFTMLCFVMLATASACGNSSSEMDASDDLDSTTNDGSDSADDSTADSVGDGSEDGLNLGDTSAFSGFLAWTTGTTVPGGVRVWDLANSRFALKKDRVDDETYDSPALSSDGSTVAYVLGAPATFDGNDVGVRRLTLVDLANGDERSVPDETDGTGQYRRVFYPSLTEDGQTVVFDQQLWPVDGTTPVLEANIARWDGTGQPEVLIESRESINRCATITGDGRTLFFMSNRDADDGDIYRMDLDSRDMERLSIYTRAEVESLRGFPIGDCGFEVSDDGSLVMFEAGLTTDESGLFVMDTSSGAITRLDDSVVGAYRFLSSAASLARDGSHVIFTVVEGDLLASAHSELYYVDLAQPSNPILVKESSAEVDGASDLPKASPSWIALSNDGRTIAAGLVNYAAESSYDILAVMRADGTEVTNVVDTAGSQQGGLGLKDITF